MRKAASLTQRELAESIGLTESAVRNYELGLRTPGDGQLAAMGIAPEALKDIKVDSARKALEVLFRLEGKLDLVPLGDGESIGPAIDQGAELAPIMYQSLVASMLCMIAALIARRRGRRAYAGKHSRR